MADQNSNIPKNNTNYAISKGKQIIISDENDQSLTFLNDHHHMIPAFNNYNRISSPYNVDDIFSYDIINEFFMARPSCSTQFPGICSTQENVCNNGNVDSNNFPIICFEEGNHVVNGNSNSSDFAIGFEQGNHVVNGNNNSNEFPEIILQQENICSNGNSNTNGFPENWMAFVDPIQTTSWKIPSYPQSCTFCQTLREYLHVNDTHTMKLEIHGRLGIICHAVQSIDNSQFYMFDFSEKSLSSVKQFLSEYCESRKREGYSILQDPLSEFYKTMNIGVDTEDICPKCQAGTSKQPQEDKNVGPSRTKRNMKLQREKMKNMKLKDLVDVFHLRLEDAAEQMAVSVTSIKNVCRDEQLRKWPYKKIKGIKSKIASKQKRLDKLEDPGERERVSKEIQDLQQTLDHLYQTYFRTPQKESSRARKKQAGRKRRYARRENQSTADASETPGRVRNVKRRGRRRCGSQVSGEAPIETTGDEIAPEAPIEAAGDEIVAEAPNADDAPTQTRQSNTPTQTRQSNRNKKNTGKRKK